jgi:hypothetical protein
VTSGRAPQTELLPCANRPVVTVSGVFIPFAIVLFVVLAAVLALT